MRVPRIWQAFGLQPHRTKPFTLSPDPVRIDTVRDSVGVYLNPPPHAAVFCVDDKPQIQAWDRTAPVLPLRPGHAERRTHDDNRARDDVALCRTGSEDGTRAGSDSSAASRDRVSRLLDRPRCPGAGRPGRARHHGQRRDAQARVDPPMVRPAPARASALHADVRRVAPSRRALVCPPSR